MYTVHACPLLIKLILKKCWLSDFDFPSKCWLSMMYIPHKFYSLWCSLSHMAWELLYSAPIHTMQVSLASNWSKWICSISIRQRPWSLDEAIIQFNIAVIYIQNSQHISYLTQIYRGVILPSSEMYPSLGLSLLYRIVTLVWSITSELNKLFQLCDFFFFFFPNWGT